MKKRPDPPKPPIPQTVPTWTIKRRDKGFDLVAAVVSAREDTLGSWRATDRVQVTVHRTRPCIVGTDGKRIHIAFITGLPPDGLYRVIVRTPSLIVLATELDTAIKYPMWSALVEEFDRLPTAERTHGYYSDGNLGSADIWTAFFAKALPRSLAIQYMFLAEIPRAVRAEDTRTRRSHGQTITARPRSAASRGAHRGNRRRALRRRTGELHILPRPGPRTGRAGGVQKGPTMNTLTDALILALDKRNRLDRLWAAYRALIHARTRRVIAQTYANPKWLDRLLKDIDGD